MNLLLLLYITIYIIYLSLKINNETKHKLLNQEFLFNNKLKTIN